MNRVTVTALNKKDKPWEKRLEVFGLKVLRSAGFRSAALDVYVAPDRVMHELNREFRHKDKPTTVLSFGPGEPVPRPDLGKGTRYLGELFVDPGYIGRQGEDVERLFIHSFLHLLGYTHERGNDRMKMEKKEKWLRSSLDSISDRRK